MNQAPDPIRGSIQQLSRTISNGPSLHLTEWNNMMTSSLFKIVLGGALTMASVGCDIAPKAEDAAAFNRSTEALVAKFSSDNQRLSKLFKNAYAYAVFPTVGMGGFVLAHGYGNGAVYVEQELVGYASVSEHAIGAIVGGDKWSLLLFFENEAAIQKFKSGTLQADATANFAAGETGGDSQTQYSDGFVAIKVDPAGLMGDASVGFSDFKYQSLAETTAKWNKK